jgi:hypothetical protein
LCACAHRNLHASSQARPSTVSPAVPTLACWWKVVFFYSACVVLIYLFAQIKTRRMDFHTKHVNTLYEGKMQNFCMLKQVVHAVITAF